MLPAAGLLLLPYVAGNGMAALLLTTARLALATSPPVVVAKTPRPPQPLDHGRAAPFGTDGHVTPASSSTNGAGPAVVVQQRRSGSNGAAAPPLQEPDLAPSSSNGSGVLKPGTGLEPFQESGTGKVRQGTASWGGRPRACMEWDAVRSPKQQRRAWPARRQLAQGGHQGRHACTARIAGQNWHPGTSCHVL
jgi:hypothetical protein